jgi:protein TonB
MHGIIGATLFAISSSVSLPQSASSSAEFAQGFVEVSLIPQSSIGAISGAEKNKLDFGSAGNVSTSLNIGSTDAKDSEKNAKISQESKLIDNGKKSKKAERSATKAELQVGSKIVPSPKISKIKSKNLKPTTIAPEALGTVKDKIVAAGGAQAETVAAGTGLTGTESTGNISSEGSLRSVVDEQQGIKLIPVKRVAPNYPPDARRKGVQGAVTLEVIVSPSGLVEDVNVISASPEGFFEQEAIRAVSRWHFAPTPAQAGSKSIRAKQLITFSLAAKRKIIK